MALKLFNTLGRKVEEFKPINENEVRMYSCGPTVYDYVHIGNLRAYVFVDLLRRYLKYKGYNLKHVMNITDVEDKTIKKSREQEEDIKKITNFFADAFFKDLKELNVEIPEILPRATDEVEGMVELIKKLMEKGYAYKVKNGDIYFSIRKLEDYGKLAMLDLDSLKSNADERLDTGDEDNKEDVRDFVLWKAWDEEDGPVYWDTEIGKGRPGWHMECSVMSSKYLGQPFDIHTGGEDLVFPHHTNEIAQSEAAYDKKFCNYWIHNSHLLVNGQKMSKSLGNFYTLRDLLDKGYDPTAIRYELLSTHYRQKLDFREDNLKKIPEVLQRIYDFLDRMDEVKNEEYNNDVPEKISKYREKFEESMDDDLNVSGAIASVFEFMNEINKIEIGKGNADEVRTFMEEIDNVLGIMHHVKEDIPEEIMEKVKEREEARKKKDFDTADRLRDEVKEKGYVIEDTKEGPRVKKEQKI